MPATRNLPIIRRHDIDNLDHALYCASCLAGSAPDRTVTIRCAVDSERNEHYQVLDGRQGRTTPKGPDGALDWQPVYIIEAVRE